MSAGERLASVIMIGHEHVGVQAQAETIHPVGEQLQELLAVTVVAEGEALFIDIGQNWGQL